jgi:hypothetical protein
MRLRSTSWARTAISDVTATNPSAIRRCWLSSRTAAGVGFMQEPRGWLKFRLTITRHPSAAPFDFVIRQMTLGGQSGQTRSMNSGHGLSTLNTL